MADVATPSGARPALSAVVFGYRNEATILRAVRSLVEQDCDDAFEVVVATSGGDRSAELVREAFPAVKVAESPTRLLPGGVRNLGTALATGDVVGYLEADCVARPGWVRDRIALHRAGHEAVASSLDAMAGDGRVARAALYLVHPARLAGHPAGPANEYQVYGLSFTRELLERAGPFDETLRSYEDTAMADRLRFLGVEPWFAPSVCIEHDGPATLPELLRDQFARGRRDSWAELLRLPAGRHRHRLEVLPGSRLLVVALRALYRWGRRVRATAAAVRDGHTGPAGELPGLVLPMVLGQIAYQLGWAADQLRGTRPGGAGAPRDQLPAPSGLRRWVTTDGDRVVALTLDGVPSATDTAGVLAALRTAEVSATFFVTGTEAVERPDEVRALAAAGHTMGSSGWSGAPWPSLSDADLRIELERTASALEELTGTPVDHVRPPGGAYDGRVVALAQALAPHIWLWTTHPLPAPTGPDAEGVARETMDALTPGSVLVLPPLNGDTAALALSALPVVVERARRRGYEFVTLSYLPAGLPAGAEPAAASAPASRPGAGGAAGTGGEATPSGSA
jgi:peptidoglycan/xylan/chitin deacetylase (PgdA/CDA1 family)/GT2 family glycosyltransferase